MAPPVSAGWPTEYRVGPVRVCPNVVLAPMENVTDLALRRLIRRLGGVGLTYTEFIPAGGISSRAARLGTLAACDPDERPIAMQLYGRDPGRMADAARLLADHGATIIDLNMGCPSKRVCRNSGGSALMREPERALALVRAVVAAVSLPVTVKMRSGFDAQSRNAPDLAWACQEEGAQAVTIHWRTRADGYGGERAVDRIAEAVARLSIPVVGNGDIVDIPSAHRMLQDTGCAGLMVGRGALMDPWLPARLTAWLTGASAPEVSLAATGRAVLAYLADLGATYRRPAAAAGRGKMLIRNLSQGLPGGDALRQAALRAETLDALMALVTAFFSGGADQWATASHGAGGRRSSSLPGMSAST